MKNLLLIALLGINYSYASSQQVLMPNIENNGIMTKAIASATTSKSTNPTKLIGGWYPVFFDSYSDSKIQDIVLQDKKGLISKIIVSYDLNQDLAEHIRTTLEATTFLDVQFEHIPLTDDTAKYNHNLVVVTIYAQGAGK